MCICIYIYTYVCVYTRVHVVEDVRRSLGGVLDTVGKFNLPLPLPTTLKSGGVGGHRKGVP